MKIINEKGKLFGIINPIDLIILLAIIAVIAAFGVKTLKNPIQNVLDNPSDGSELSDMYVSLKIRGASPALTDAIRAIEPDTPLVAGSDYVDGATVQEIKIEPYTYTSINVEGECILYTDPTKSDISVVIKSEANPDDAVLKIATQEVRTGRGFVFKTNRVEVSSVIESVRFDG